MAIRHGGDLAGNAVRGFKGAVDYPQGAGSTRAREVKGGRGLPLGNIARAVGADEGKGHALKPWALERGEALRGCFKPSPKVVAQQVDIVAGIFCHREKALVGHGDSRREVLRKAQGG